MASLYEINRNIEEILDRLYEEVDEETGEVPEDILMELADMQEERKIKLDNIGAYIKNLEAEAAAIKAEEDKLKKRRDAKSRKADRLREYLTEELLGHNEMKMETSRVKFSFRPSESVEIRDEAKIPKEYMKEKITYSPDKTSIKKAIKAGEEVDGCALIKKQNLQIE